MLTRKIYRSGNSYVVSIPQEYLKNQGLDQGSEVLVSEDDNGIIISSPKKSSLDLSAITPEFKEWLSEVTKKYSETIKELSKR